ncbi:MAG: hypothetical protein P8J81_07605 [Luminiphilus sp.]|nr:hypothetical protein [Luminiphilus sp.]MDG2136127.1 hypothetical protein [Luminiphilus sp.]
MDYLLAVLVGCVGILGLSEITFDIVVLNTQAYEMTLGILTLSEAVALSRFGVTEGSPVSEWCGALPEQLRDRHCNVLNDWLGMLMESQLRITPEGLVILGWLSSSGEYLELSQPIWTR